MVERIKRVIKDEGVRTLALLFIGMATFTYVINEIPTKSHDAIAGLIIGVVFGYGLAKSSKD